MQNNNSEGKKLRQSEGTKGDKYKTAQKTYKPIGKH